jgi:hypothetical protein
MIANDTFRVIRMMPQLGASLTIIILMTLEVSFMLIVTSIMLLDNIYSTGITHDNCHLQSSYFYSTLVFIGYKIIQIKWQTIQLSTDIYKKNNNSFDINVLI